MPDFLKSSIPVVLGLCLGIIQMNFEIFQQTMRFDFDTNFAPMGRILNKYQVPLRQCAPKRQRMDFDPRPSILGDMTDL